MHTSGSPWPSLGQTVAPRARSRFPPAAGRVHALPYGVRRKQSMDIQAGLGDLPVDTSAPVLVVGATGCVAGWIVKDLLDAGGAVHAAVRDPDNAVKVRYAQRARGAGRSIEVLFRHCAKFLDGVRGQGWRPRAGRPPHLSVGLVLRPQERPPCGSGSHRRTAATRPRPLCGHDEPRVVILAPPSHRLKIKPRAVRNDRSYLRERRGVVPHPQQLPSRRGLVRPYGGGHALDD